MWIRNPSAVRNVDTAQTKALDSHTECPSFDAGFRRGVLGKTRHSGKTYLGITQGETRSEAHPVPLIQPMVDDVVACRFEIFVGELVISTLGFLQGHHVNVETMEGVNHSAFSCSNRIDVPGGNSHPFSLRALTRLGLWATREKNSLALFREKQCITAISR